MSLKWFNLKLFNKYNIIPVGFLWFHKYVKYLNINFSFLIEPVWFYPFVRYPPGTRNFIVNPIQSNYKKIIKNNRTTTFFIDRSNYFALMCNKNIKFIIRKFFFDKLESKQLSKQFNCFTGSFRFAIACAIKLNYKKIYLVGFDYTHTPPRALHWYEKGTGIIQQNDGYEKDFILAAKNFADIITITLDGKSNHLDYITYKDFSGEDPVYQKNTEIVSPENLKILSSWPGYTIY